MVWAFWLWIAISKVCKKWRQSFAEADLKVTSYSFLFLLSLYCRSRMAASYHVKGLSWSGITRATIKSDWVEALTQDRRHSHGKGFLFYFYILDLGMKYDLVLGMLDCFDLGVWVRFDFVLGFLFENVSSQFYLLFFLIVFYSFFFFFLFLWEDRRRYLSTRCDWIWTLLIIYWIEMRGLRGDCRMWRLLICS